MSYKPQLAILNLSEFGLYRAIELHNISSLEKNNHNNTFNSEYKQWIENKDLLKSMNRQRFKLFLTTLSFPLSYRHWISLSSLLSEALNSEKIEIEEKVPEVKIFLPMGFVEKTNSHQRIIDQFSAYNSELTSLSPIGSHDQYRYHITGKQVNFKKTVQIILNEMIINRQNLFSNDQQPYIKDLMMNPLIS